MKRTHIIFIAAFLLLGTVACGTEQINNSNINNQNILQEEEGSDNQIASDHTKDLGKETIQSETEQKDTEWVQKEEVRNNAGDWKSAYIKYLDSLKNTMDEEEQEGCTYSLIYVNEDEIPELVIDTGNEAGGCQILTYQDGKVDVLQTRRLNFGYFEKKNLLCNSDGNMGCYYDDVYTINDGKWEYIAGGEWGDGEDGMQVDEKGDLIYVYRWEGEEMEESAYEAKLKEVFDWEQAKRPERYYILTEMKSLLETGKTTSADHRYELVVEDVTWTEAQERCKEKGGYLATVTSMEEMETIQNQIVAEGKTKINFWVGAKNMSDEGFFGYSWIEYGENNLVYDMTFHFNVFQDLWLEGEPSYEGMTEDGETVEENYVDLFYRSSEKRCVLNDVPEDMLKAAPSYAGKIGYICEYR